MVTALYKIMKNNNTFITIMLQRFDHNKRAVGIDNFNKNALDRGGLATPMAVILRAAILSYN